MVPCTPTLCEHGEAITLANGSTGHILNRAIFYGPSSGNIGVNPNIDPVLKQVSVVWLCVGVCYIVH